jgi:SAM-dependent methyltransferase
MHKCVFCDENCFKPLFEIKGGDFELLQCENCGLVFTSPEPNIEELKKYYSRDYYSFKELAAPPQDVILSFQQFVRRIFFKYYYGRDKKVNFKEKLLLFFFQDRFGPFKKSLSIGKILDVGSGDGFFLSSAKELGWEVSGVEPDETAAAFAMSLGLNVFAGILEEAKYDSNYFDAVRLSHSLEHTYNPGGTILEAYRVLKPGGSIIVSVPNFSGLALKLFRSKLDVPKHLFHFSPKTLKQYLLRCGFKDIEINHYSVGIIQSGLPSFFQKKIFTPFFLVIDKMLNIIHLSDSFIIIGSK